MAFEESVKRVIYLVGGLVLAFVLTEVIKSTSVVQSTEVISHDEFTIYLPQILDWLFAGLGYTVLVMAFSPISGIVQEYSRKVTWARSSQAEILQTYLGLYLVASFAIALSWTRGNLTTLLGALGIDADLSGLSNLLFGVAIVASGIYTVVHGAKVWSVASDRLAAKIAETSRVAVPAQTVSSGQISSSGVPCQNCGNALPAEVGFCPRCGTPVPKTAASTQPAAQAASSGPAGPSCQHCNNSLPVGVTFCPRCGGKVAEMTSGEPI